jgi:hypothetical protein
MREENQFDVPFQVQQLLVAMQDKKERVNVRGNYRMRLEGIKRAIDKAITDYDTEMGTVNTFKRRKTS